jgi:hypothetical protein
MNKVLEQAPDWIDRGQAATVLKAIAVFEDVLQACLEGCMRPLTPRMRERLFNGYGPISSFSAKTDIAYALNLLTDHDHADLQIKRKIRNEFAHSREVMGFEKCKIKKMVSRLQKPSTEADTAYRWYFARLNKIGHRVIDATGGASQRSRPTHKPSAVRRLENQSVPASTSYFSLK